MNNMTKFAVLAALSLGLASAAAACGDDTTTTTTTGTPGGTGAQGGTGPGGSGPGGTGPGGGAATVPELGAQVDRMGRPAINTALSTPVPLAASDAAKDTYNKDGVASAWKTTFTAGFAAYLGVFDGLDEVCGNQVLYGGLDGPADCPGAANATPPATVGTAADCYVTLAGVLASDWLVVNGAGTGDAGYLGVEVETITAAANPVAVGGRLPSDDTILTSYTVLSGQFGASVVDDGISAPAEVTAAEDAFPYLPDPM